MKMPELKPCPFCGNERIGTIRSRQMGVPSGDDGWKAECQCSRCHVIMTFWALKETWAEEALIRAWNRRATQEV